MTTPLQIGFIPLIDAAALIVAVEKGFTRAEGLDVQLVRGGVVVEDVRDKLNIGLVDAAHILAPGPVASSLGLGHIKVPIVVPLTLNLNGNAITVSAALHAAITAEIDGDPLDPMATARALSRVVATRRRSGGEPLNFGMTFPFSTHNYQLRFWMAAGGVDPDEDVRLVVLPPPFMVDSIAGGQIDGFCVGAPWNSIAVDRGVGRIHYTSAPTSCGVRQRKCWRSASNGRRKIRKRLATAWSGRSSMLPSSLRRPTTGARSRGILAKRSEYVGVDASVDPANVGRGRLKIAVDAAPSAKATITCCWRRRTLPARIRSQAALALCANGPLASGTEDEPAGPESHRARRVPAGSL